MWIQALIVIIAITTGMSNAAIQRRRGWDDSDDDYAKENYCNQKVNTADNCPVEEMPLLGILFEPHHRNSQKDFLKAVKKAGIAQLCQEVDEALTCAVDLVKDASKECDKIQGLDVSKVLSIAETVHSFQQEICSPDFGDWDAHLDCFTDPELHQSAMYCTRTIKPDLKLDNFISCINDVMDEYPDICDEEAKELNAKVIRRAAELARPYLKDRDFPGRKYMRKILKF